MNIERATALAVSSDKFLGHKAQQIKTHRETSGLFHALDMQFYLPCALLIFFNYILFDLFFGFAKLPQAVYEQPFIISGALLQWKTHVWFLPLLLLAGWATKSTTWQKIDSSNGIRYFISAVCFTLAWKFTTYDLNLFYGHAHYLDRLLLFALALLVLVRPTFTLPFLAFLFVIIGQLAYPIGGYSWTDKIIPLSVLVLFISYLLLFVARPLPKTVFLFVLLCMVGADYFVPAVAKIDLSPQYFNWLFDNKLQNIFVSSYLNGWLANVPQESILKIAAVVTFLNVFLLIISLAIELGGLLMLVSRSAAKIALLGFIFLHLGIFFASGIFFWKWIFVDFALWVLLSRLDSETEQELFTKSKCVVGVLIIAGGNFLFHTVYLGWFDTAVNQLYRIEAIGESGQRYNVSAKFLSPYDMTIAQNRFFYLSDEPRIVGANGTTSSFADFAVLDKRGKEAISDLKQAKRRELSEKEQIREKKRVSNFDLFFKRYFKNLNDRGAKHTLLKYAAAPSHIHYYAAGNVYALQERVKEIRIHYEETYFGGTSVEILQRKQIRRIKIPQ